MSTSDIENALYSHLRTLPSSPPVAWPGRLYRPIEGVTHLVPRFFPNRSDYGAIGVNSPVRYRGLLQVTVKGAIDKGIEDGSIADAIIDHFEMEIVEYNTIRVRIGSSDGSPGVPYRSASFTEGSWNLIPVTIPWWSDQF